MRGDHVIERDATTRHVRSAPGWHSTAWSGPPYLHFVGVVDRVSLRDLELGDLGLERLGTCVHGRGHGHSDEHGDGHKESDRRRRHLLSLL